MQIIHETTTTSSIDTNVAKDVDINNEQESTITADEFKDKTESTDDANGVLTEDLSKQSSTETTTKPETESAY